MVNKKLITVVFAIVIAVIGVIFFQFNNQSSTPEQVQEIDPQEVLEKQVLEEKYDVIVVGGEPEGVAAAVSAARNGAKTLLIEKRDGLGGLMTYGLLNFIDIGVDRHGEYANKGIFTEWHNMVGGDIAFDIDTAKDAFLKLAVSEENLTVKLNTNVDDVIMSEDGTTVTSIKITNEQDGEKTVAAKKFIDSTQDADFAVMAGVPYYTGGEDINLKDRKMAVTLMIHLKNVDWNGIKQTAESKKFGEGAATETVAWGFGDLHFDYKPIEENTRLRGLNIVKASDDTVYINALQIFGVDGLSEEEKQQAIEKGKRETEHIVEYLRKEFPGFENAEIASVPEELYVRETRHIKAEYQLPMADVWRNRDHWDSIGFGAYPVDVQATSIHDYGMVVSAPTQYAIPFRSLVPLEIDGLLVASRSSGYSSLAAGSVRVIPSGMTAGEAAGAAASLAIENEVTFREMAQSEELIHTLQETLKEQGANLYSYEAEYAYQGEWYDDAVTLLINYGLVGAGYQNDVGVEKPMSELQFYSLLKNGIARTNQQESERLEQRFQALQSGLDQETILTRDRAAEIILQVMDSSVSGPDLWKKALEENLIDEEIYNRITENRELQKKEGFYIAAFMLEKFITE
jgi:hypothetical protein